nr:hypothetical protein GCM10020092_076780 [Actinoplanes digitatis]
MIGVGERHVDALDDQLKSWMTHYHQVPNVTDVGALTDTVRWIQDKVWVDRLEATIEAHTLAAAQVRENCTIPGTSARTAWLCRDKPSMKEVLRSAGVPTAASTAASTAEQVHEFADAIGYPLILKPRTGAGAQDTIRVDNREQLDEALGRFGGQHVSSIAVEEFVEGHEGFYDTVSIDGHAALDFVSHYYPNVLEAMRTRWISPQFVSTNRVDSPSSDYAELREMGARVNEALGIGTSATHMEWFFGPKGLRFSEIGCSAARRRCLGPLLGGQRPRHLPGVGERGGARAHRHPSVATVRHRDRRAAPGPRRQYHRLLRRRRRAGPLRPVGDRRAPAAARHTDPAGRGRLLGERVRPDAPPGLRHAAGTPRRRGPHRPGARRVNVRAVAEGDPDLAINRLRRQTDVDGTTVDRFLARHGAPVSEGRFCTFLYRGEADTVRLAQRIIDLPDRLPMHRLPGTDLWYVIVEMPTDSRVEYQIEVGRARPDRVSQRPAQPQAGAQPGRQLVGLLRTRLRRSGLDGAGSRGAARSARRPGGAQRHADPRLPGDAVPARASCCPTGNYRLLIVHDGGDFLRYAAARTVLDNLIHRRLMAETVVAFLHPKDRLNEYADSAEHAEFVTRELLPLLENDFPLAGDPSTRCLLGSSFGAVASLSMARRYPGTYGSLALLSGSFVSSRPDGAPHGGGPTFDPVVAFVDDYRRRPTRVADRVFVGCGAFEPLIVRQPSMLAAFRSTGMHVRYVESHDGHTWVNWRDRLCDALSWALPPG